jgi:chromosomal replication initiation ATPase DnaA
MTKTIVDQEHEINKIIARAEEQIKLSMGLDVCLTYKWRFTDNKEVKEVMAIIAEALNMKFTDYYGGRYCEYVDLRTIAYLFLKKLYHLTLSEMAVAMKLKDHTTIIHGLRRGRNLLRVEDREFVNKYELVKIAIKRWQSQKNTI